MLLQINKLQWNVVMGNTDKEFLKKLSDIMYLSDGNSLSKIILFRSDIEEVIKKYYPIKKDWKVYENSFIKYMSHAHSKDILCQAEKKDEDTDFMLCKHGLFNPVFTDIINAGGLPVHSALLEKKGKGFLLIGQNSSGKSTCARMVQKPYKALSDDISIVINGKAHPFPTWTNFTIKKHEKKKRWNVKRSVPVKALFFLEKSNRDEIQEIEKDKTLYLLMNSVYEAAPSFLSFFDKEEKRQIRTQIFNNTLTIIKPLPVFTLKFTKDGQFWKKIEEVI